MDTHNFAHRMFRWLVFKVGDLRRIAHFPFVTWDVHSHKIDLNEVINDALPKLREGDIIVHRDDGYASNIAIGGAMTHAGIYVGNGQVVEALSDGVVIRHAAHILYSDRAAILRPTPNVISPLLAKDAAEIAKTLIGYPYDYLFEFNTQEEMRTIDLLGKEGAIKAGVKFCCTEVASYCYMKYADALRIYRRKNISVMTKLLKLFGLTPGDKIISGDMYVTANFDIVWLSKEFTADWADKMGCTEEYVAKIAAYKR